MPQPAAPVCWLLAEQLSAGMVFGIVPRYLAAWLYSVQACTGAPDRARVHRRYTPDRSTISIVPQLLTCSCWCVESWMGTTAVGVGIPSYSSTAVVQTPKADSLFIAGLATMLAIGIPATAKTAPEFMKTEEYLDLVRAILSTGSTALITPN
jgi:hypothetical protein